MEYKIQKVIREMGVSPVFDYLLLNKWGVEVGKFHDEKFALKVRDLLNEASV